MAQQDAGERQESRVALITGGLSGIGEATAYELAGVGFRLVLCDRSLARGQEVLAAVRAAGGDAELVQVDVRDPQGLERAAQVAVARFGRLDALIAGAGVSDQSTVAAGDPDRWRVVVETNLLGTIYAARAVLPLMVARGEGHIVVIASVSGRETYPGESVYIASKWGQVGFAHSLRQEVMDAGVRVTLIEPGLVDTPLTRGNPLIRPLLEAVQPLAPQDVARAITYVVCQPAHVVVSEVTVRPLRQRISDLGVTRGTRPGGRAAAGTRA
jgi:NADP-dependent 3-hydroxy acid dehydrogenase YdfG